jgi:hypothetical protein
LNIFSAGRPNRTTAQYRSSFVMRAEGRLIVRMAHRRSESSSVLIKIRESTGSARRSDRRACPSPTKLTRR